MERKPWICPACGVGCAPHVDHCGACALAKMMAPIKEALRNPPPLPPNFEPFPASPFVNPTPLYPAPHVGDWFPWPGNGIFYTAPSTSMVVS